MGTLTGLSPLPEDPDIAVVVPARNAGATLAAAVSSALGQEVPGALEVVIAIGPSVDDTAEVAERLAREHPPVRTVDSPTGTTPASLNLAIAASSAPVVARLDAHAQLPAGYLQAAADELRRDPSIANVGGRQVPVAEAGFARAVALAMASPAGSGGATYRHGTHAADVDTVYLGVFRREALDEVGRFDQSLLRNQDYELNIRLRAAGYAVRFLPELAVSYRPRSSPTELWRQYHDYGAWKRRVLRRDPGSARLRQLAAPVLVLGLLVGSALGVAAGAWLPLAVLAGAYGATTLVAGVLASRGRPLRGVQVAFALTLMHLSWGVGFLVGRAGSRSP